MAIASALPFGMKARLLGFLCCAQPQDAYYFPSNSIGLAEEKNTSSGRIKKIS